MGLLVSFLLFDSFGKYLTLFSFHFTVDVAKYNRGNDGSDMLAPVSSQAAGAGLQSAATQAHNQPYAMNTFPPGYGHFYYNPIPQQGHHAYYASAAQHPMYPVQAAQAAQAGGASAASSAFAKAAAANSANAYGSHSGYTTSSAGYDSLMGAGGSTGGGGLADYGGSVGKGGQGGSSYVGGGQQMGGQAGQHKGQMGGVSASDLSGSGGQSMYGGKNHSSMNKVSCCDFLLLKFLVNFSIILGLRKASLPAVCPV